MDKVSFTNLKLKINNDTKSFDFNGQNIEVFQYVSIADKDDMIQSIIQNSVNRGIYNPIKADMYFHLYLVYLYTNITFTKKQKEDEEKIEEIFNELITIEHPYTKVISKKFEEKFKEKLEKKCQNYSKSDFQSFTVLLDKLLELLEIS